MLTYSPILVAITKLVTRFSPAEEGILRLYAYYKRMQRTKPNGAIPDDLAHAIQGELHLLLKDDTVVRLLARSIYYRLTTEGYKEDYFVELATWIVKLRQGGMDHRPLTSESTGPIM